MLVYTLKRFGYMLLSLFIITTATFFMMHSIPGNPLGELAKQLPQQTIELYEEAYGLNKPVTEQYGIFLKNLVTEGDLGASIRYPGRSVTNTITETAPISARLGFQALAVGIPIGILFGIIAALFRGKAPDYIVSVLAIVGITIPVFVLASIFQYLFAVKLQWVPTSGYGRPIQTILPTLAMCFGSIATYARYLRSNILEVLGQDYILTAEAKGVSRFSVVVKHVLRNAILPAITIIGPQVAAIFTGSFIVERMFNIPGLGFYYVNSIQMHDYPMIIGTTVFYAALFIFSQFVVDLLYGVVDPRIRLS